MWCVYILKSEQENWFYVGSTNRITERFNEHNKGKVRSTKHYKPFIIIYRQDFDDEVSARYFERKLKDCRIEKERIINNYLKNIGIACLRRQV